MKSAGLTIGRLARAAGVGIETVRHYQRLGLLPAPAPATGAFRRYPPALADRIRFVKRAQDLGFTLAEIATLLELEDGADRAQIRDVAAARLAQIRDRIADLRRMERALAHLLHECEATANPLPCPIISALLDEDQAHATSPRS